MSFYIIKNNEHKTQLTIAERQERGHLMPCNNSKTHQEEAKVFFYPGKKQIQWNASHCVYSSPPTLLFPFIKISSFPCLLGTCIWLILVVGFIQLLNYVWFFAAGQTSLSFISPGVCSNLCPLRQWCHPAIQLSHSLLLFSPPGLNLSQH